MTIVTPTISQGSYAQYSGFDEIGYNCIKYLRDNDQVIWKLLKYNTPDAWNKANLTVAEKNALIYDGSDNTADFHVFQDMGQPDVETSETCIIRVHPYAITAANRVVGSIKVMFEVYSHYKINHLDNYKTRNDMIVQRFLQTFNGATIEGLLGTLHLDDMGTYGTRMETGGQLPFRGKWILLGTKSN